MIVPSKIKSKLESLAPLISRVSEIVEGHVLNFCKVEGYAYSARAKSVESLCEKLETGRFSRWSELDDLFACTIVIPDLTRELSVITFLESVFVKHSLRQRGGTRKAPDQFRFDATRFVGKLKPLLTDTGHEPVYQICFEVQVRTAFEHAWCTATHPLTYKSASIEWSRLRLAAQLKAAVEQLDLLILAFSEAAERISVSDWPEITARKRMQSIFMEAATKGVIPTECIPQDWSRFTENLYSLLRSCSSPGSKAEYLLPRVLTVLETGLQANQGDKFPRSISLFQFALGCLMESGVFSPALPKGTLPVTEELATLFPAVRNIPEVFQFDL